MQQRILMVDDEINSLKVLSSALRKSGYEVDTARSGEEGYACFIRGQYHLIISDYKMPGMSGEKLLELVKTHDAAIPFILLTAYGSIEMAVNAMKKGAYTYLTKPVDLNLLEDLVRDVLLGQTSTTGQAKDSTWQFYNILGQSSAMQEVFSLIRRVSKTEANILILGESGTGKELVARAIHYNSYHADKPFIAIDCTTIPAELMESELFGHEKGSFTGATERKIGLVEMANGGTIFLDEIGDLDFALQKKLLRFLQEKEFRRVGGKIKIKVDIRLLSATNRNLEKDVEAGKFRSDLFYRLNVITIRIPPLRERREDIALISRHYLQYFSEKNQKRITGFESEVLPLLSAYDWPGNVRELENTIERAVILCPFESINVESLSRKFKDLASRREESVDEMTLPELEKKVVGQALEKASWNQSKAAALLGISRKQLRTKMKNYDL